MFENLFEKIIKLNWPSSIYLIHKVFPTYSDLSAVSVSILVIYFSTKSFPLISILDNPDAIY